MTIDPNSRQAYYVAHITHHKSSFPHPLSLPFRVGPVSSGRICVALITVINIQILVFA